MIKDKTTQYGALLCMILILNAKVSAQNAPSTEEASLSQKPNIIYILTDDLGFGDLGVLFQNQRAKDDTKSMPREFTPNLDQMAAEGALLPHHYTAAPVCAPSRASFLLGRSQGHANVRDNQFDKALEDNLTVASTLRQAGYATAAIGKWGLQGRQGTAPNWSAHPLNRGFDYFLGYMRHRDGHEHYPKEGIYRGKKEVYENRTDISENLDKCYTADLWTAAAKKWIVEQQSLESNQPFFIFLAYDTPHAVLELPTQAYPSGGGLEGGLQWTGRPGQMINTASGEVDSWIHPDYSNAVYDADNDAKTPQKPWPDVYKRYATDTRRIDSAVGDLIQLLKNLNIDENTMIVFTSDNGPSRESYLEEAYEPTFFKSYGPFDGIKRDTWEGGMRMPTIARWPGNIPKGHTIETPSISYDWMPTFIDMARMPIPALSDGVSLLPSLLGEGEQPASHIYVEYSQGGETPAYEDFLPERQGRKRGQMQMMRLGDTVAIRYDIQDYDDDFEIYNVVNDQQQKDNLASNPEMDAFQQKLKFKTLRSRIHNNTATRPYDAVPIPAVEAQGLEDGVSWKSFKGYFPWIPEMRTLTTSAEGNAQSLDIVINAINKSDGSEESGGTEESDALYFEGLLKVPRTGEYTFYLSTNGSGLLRIHEAAVIDAGQGYFANSAKSGKIVLSEGSHPFRLYYTKSENRKMDIQLEWSGPNLEREQIPANAFFQGSE